MKLIFTCITFLFLGTIVKAQTIDELTALQLVSKNQQAIGLSSSDVTNSKISATYIVTGTNIRMVYLQ